MAPAALLWAGHPIPYDTDTHQETPVTIIAATRDARTIGDGTITREEYMRRTEHADRPLSDNGQVRLHQSPTMRLLGGGRG